LYPEYIPAGNVGIPFGGTEGGVPQKFLDVFNISTVFHKMGSEGVAETMNRKTRFLYPRFVKGLIKDVLGGTHRQMR
jgi:hypothetical protein